MARNEEKQQGRLNRLWLQKEREDGRIKDVQERRPKLSTLNSACSVKKWIPSINKEIEYYLQQSQLSHYPERKIAEFHHHIEALQKEYKRFITKLRVLDPSCKHKPWTPRAYSKRRADQQDSPRNEKSSRLCDSPAGSLQQTGSETDFTSNGRRSLQSSTTEESLIYSEAKCQSHHSTEHLAEGPFTVQDQPLSFDRTRLAVAAAAFRCPSGQSSSSQTLNLAKLLQSGLPNLTNFQPRQTKQRKDAEGSDAGVKCPSDGLNDSHRKSSNSDIREEQRAHILGLSCYSSSDDDCDM